MYHLTLGSRVIKKKKKVPLGGVRGFQKWSAKIDREWDKRHRQIERETKARERVLD